MAEPKSEPKKLFIKTYGCQMNVYDSERMAEAMMADGYISTDVAEEADLVRTLTVCPSDNFRKHAHNLPDTRVSF